MNRCLKVFTKKDRTFRFNFLAALAFPFRALGTILYVAALFVMCLVVAAFTREDVFLGSEDEAKAPEKVNGRCAVCRAAAATGATVMNCANCSVVTAAA